MGFQTSVNYLPNPGAPGSFASNNPIVTVPCNGTGFVAGVGGVTIGKFAWIDPDGLTVHSYGTAPAAPDGFVVRAMQGLITAYGADNSMVIPAGNPVTLMQRADMNAKVAGSTAATRGAAVYAMYATGDATVGSAATGGSVTASMGSTNTAAIGATFTGSADSVTTQLVVTGVTGFISIGDVVSGTGITSGTTILSQVSGTPNGAGTYGLSATNTASSATVTCFGSVLKTTSTTGLISIGETVAGGAGFPTAATVLTQVSGTPGGAGVYTLSAPATHYVASATGVTTFGNVLNVTAVGSGTIAVGFPVSGSGITANSAVATQVSGTALGVGVYTLTLAATAYAVSTTVTATGGVDTGWKCANACAVGEIAMITKWS